LASKKTKLNKAELRLGKKGDNKGEKWPEELPRTEQPTSIAKKEEKKVKGIQTVRPTPTKKPTERGGRGKGGPCFK